MKITDFVKQHATAIYFLLTILLSWAFVVILAKPGNIPINPEKSKDLLPVLYVSMLIGPSFAGILLTILTKGKKGFRSLLTRISRWRISIRWYFFAILFTPMSAILLLIILAKFNNEFQSSLFKSVDITTQLLNGLMAGIMVGIFEELGWTGFAVPRLMKRKSVLAIGLLVGIIWGAWHFILFWQEGSFLKVIPILILLGQLFAWLPPFRVLMVWIYSRTESLLLIILMHVSLVVTTTAIVPLNLAGRNLLIWIIVWSIYMWGVVFVINFSTDNKEKSLKTNSNKWLIIIERPELQHR